MRFAAASFFLAGLAAAVPVEVSESVAVESRNAPAIDPHLYIIDEPLTSGTGCPKGTAHVIFDKDLQAFSINFDKYVVETGPDHNLHSTANCKATLHVGFDKGLTFSLLQTDLDGFANLESGVTGKAITDFTFTGGQGHPKYEIDFKGPYNDLFDLHADPTLIAYSPCGSGSAILNINTLISLSPIAPGPKKGYIGVSDLQGFLTQKFHLKWAKC